VACSKHGSPEHQAYSHIVQFAIVDPRTFPSKQSPDVAHHPHAISSMHVLQIVLRAQRTFLTPNKKSVLFVLLSIVSVVFAFNNLAGNTPTPAQTGELEKNTDFLFGVKNVRCARNTICKTCIEDIACGWCATSGLCFDGNVLGSTIANCTMWEYAWCSGEPCLEHATCYACNSDPLCGWCSSTQTCTEGGAQGPMFGDCPPDQWFGSTCDGAPNPTQFLLQTKKESIEENADE